MTVGPKLKKSRYWSHMCSKLQHPNGKNYIVLAGGDLDYHYPKSVELIDIDCFDLLGEELCHQVIDKLTCDNENIQKLCQHSCEICNSYGNSLSQNFYLGTSFLLMHTFSLGPVSPDLPIDYEIFSNSQDYGTMIPTPNEQGVILLGLKRDPKQIYQLSWKGDELQWSKIGQLKSPRSFTVAMWIPNELTNCTIPT